MNTLKNFIEIKGCRALTDYQKKLFGIKEKRLPSGWYNKYKNIQVDDTTWSELMCSVAEYKDALKLKQNNKPFKYIYIIKNYWGHFKIGMTGDIKTRMNDLSVGNSMPLKLVQLYAKKGRVRLVESLLHKKYQDIRLNGEWFDSTLPLSDVDSFLLSNDFIRMVGNERTE